MGLLRTSILATLLLLGCSSRAPVSTGDGPVPDAPNTACPAQASPGGACVGAGSCSYGTLWCGIPNVSCRCEDGQWSCWFNDCKGLPPPDLRSIDRSMPDRGVPDAPVSPCPGPCPPTHACIEVFPGTGKGMCLKECASGCNGNNEFCHVARGGINYCMSFCYWKGFTFPCPDPQGQQCVDAYSIPGHLLPPGYPGSTVCAPK